MDDKGLLLWQQPFRFGAATGANLSLSTKMRVKKRVFSMKENQQRFDDY